MKKLLFGTLAIGMLIFVSCYKQEGKWWVETCREDFADGSFDGGGNLYASWRGDVQVVYSHDLNSDSFPDIVFSNYASDISYNIDSVIYWGSASGFLPLRKTLLPTHASIAHAYADLNNDGFMDLVFGSWQSKDHDFKDYGPDKILRFFGSQSLIYWGSAMGFDKALYCEFSTYAPTGISIADINNDGYLDLVVASSRDDEKAGFLLYWGSDKGFGSGRATAVPAFRSMIAFPADLNGDGLLDVIAGNLEEESLSRIYYGSREGFLRKDTEELPTSFVRSIAVADLNKDSCLDIIFANGKDKKSFETNSFIYWGSKSGYDKKNRAELPTIFAMQPAVADLNRDGWLDVVFANCGDGKRYDINSYIFYGSAKGFSTENRIEILTVGAHSVSLGDYDKNGEIDLVFSSTCSPDGKTATYDSFLYYQKNGEFGPREIRLPTQDGHHNSNRDLGNIYDRVYRDVYVSSVFDARDAVKWERVEWDAEIPAGCSIKVFLRIGEKNVSEGDWLRVKNGEKNIKNSRGQFCQYKAEFTYDGSGRPKLEEVRIGYRKPRSI